MGDVMGFQINLIILLTYGQSRNKGSRTTNFGPLFESGPLVENYHPKIYVHGQQAHKKGNKYRNLAHMCIYIYIIYHQITLEIPHFSITTSQTYNTGLIHL
jgi:hypothetical protein